MKKILLFLICVVSINALAIAHTTQPIKTQYPPVPWEVMGVSEDELLTTRVERLKTPDGWIVKILTLKNGMSINYLYIPDSKHEWGLFSSHDQKLIDMIKLN